MNKLIFYFSTLLLLFVSCKKDCAKKPCEQMDDSCPPPLAFYKELYKNLDWENYNNVWDVIANNSLECSDPRVNQNNNKSIKVYGWLMRDNNKITMTNDSVYALSGQREHEGRGSCNITINCSSEVKTLLDTYDLSKKCFLKGKLKLEIIQNGKGVFCCKMGAHINLENINDIYFE